RFELVGKNSLWILGDNGVVGIGDGGIGAVGLIYRIRVNSEIAKVFSVRGEAGIRQVRQARKRDLVVIVDGKRDNDAPFAVVKPFLSTRSQLSKEPGHKHPGRVVGDRNRCRVTAHWYSINYRSCSGIDGAYKTVAVVAHVEHAIIRSEGARARLGSDCD